MYKTFRSGFIEIITGPMFSGKSEELIKRIRILGHAGVKTLVVKHSIDNRWKEEKIVSRAGTTIDTFLAANTEEIEKKLTPDYEAIAIDEAQFFDESIVALAKKLAGNGMRVIISCLDMNFLGEPFGFTSKLLAIAEFVTKLKAVCFKCSNAASMSFRIINSKKMILIGSKEYQARCRRCHQEG